MGDNNPNQADQQLVISLMAIKNDKFEVWKYFEERADRLSDQLWTIGIWFVAVLTAILSLPFIAPGFIEVSENALPLSIKARLPVGAIAALGMAVCVFAYIVLIDVRTHVEENWRRSRYARTSCWETATWGGRKRHAWRVLLAVGVAMFAAFFFLLLSALSCT